MINIFALACKLLALGSTQYSCLVVFEEIVTSVNCSSYWSLCHQSLFDDGGRHSFCGFILDDIAANCCLFLQLIYVFSAGYSLVDIGIVMLANTAVSTLNPLKNICLDTAIAAFASRAAQALLSGQKKFFIRSV